MVDLLAQSDSLNPIATILGSALYLFLMLGLYVTQAVALMTIANKTGTPNAWFAWVPILNIILMLQIAELELWYIVLCFIPCVNLAVYIYIWWKVAERRGKPGPIALAMLIPVVNFFVPLYIAFSDN